MEETRLIVGKTLGVSDDLAGYLTGMFYRKIMKDFFDSFLAILEQFLTPHQTIDQFLASAFPESMTRQYLWSSLGHYCFLSWRYAWMLANSSQPISADEWRFLKIAVDLFFWLGHRRIIQSKISWSILFIYLFAGYAVVTSSFIRIVSTWRLAISNLTYFFVVCDGSTGSQFINRSGVVLFVSMILVALTHFKHHLVCIFWLRIMVTRFLIFCLSDCLRLFFLVVV